MIGLNIGSGQRRFAAPWVNCDLVYDRHKPDVACDGAALPFADGSMDYVVLHHVLEHFGCGEANKLVTESHRVLKDGGSLLVFVPNLRALAQRWLTRQIDDFGYLVNLYGAYLSDEASRHKWGYSQESLLPYLQARAPWRKATTFDWRRIEGASIARDWWIASAEVVK